ncbi:hypothetical protein [Roseateles sp. MS654]|uniref:hypothetical protein n=1 Tax=Roseateles sp. MS654 TaxID=3412685 RepID=UPI003C2D9248
MIGISLISRLPFLQKAFFNVDPPQEHLLKELERDSPGLHEKVPYLLDSENTSKICRTVLDIGQLISAYIEGRGYVYEDREDIAERNKALLQGVTHPEKKSMDQLKGYLEESDSLLRLLNVYARCPRHYYHPGGGVFEGDIVRSPPFEPSKNLVGLKNDFASLKNEFEPSPGVGLKEFDDLIHKGGEAKLEDPDNLKEMKALYVKARNIFNKAREESGRSPLGADGWNE